jgi:hypothetical protein
VVFTTILWAIHLDKSVKFEHGRRSLDSTLMVTVRFYSLLGRFRIRSTPTNLSLDNSVDDLQGGLPFYPVGSGWLWSFIGSAPA